MSNTVCQIKLIFKFLFICIAFASLKYLWDLQKRMKTESVPYPKWLCTYLFAHEVVSCTVGLNFYLLCFIFISLLYFIYSNYWLLILLLFITYFVIYFALSYFLLNLYLFCLTLSYLLYLIFIYFTVTLFIYFVNLLVTSTKLTDLCNPATGGNQCCVKCWISVWYSLKTHEWQTHLQSTLNSLNQKFEKCWTWLGWNKFTNCQTYL